MGPFLGRKRQTSQLRSLAEIHAELESWYATIPTPLRYGPDGHPDANQPALNQTQAIALQLAYDNLQIVLHRQAVFPKTDAAAMRVDRTLSLQQLRRSATRTGTVSGFPATDRICRSSHAAMHVGMCSFSAGVILCALLATPNNALSEHDRESAVVSLDNIISLLDNFPGQNYRFAQQSVRILQALRAKISSEVHTIDGGQAYDMAPGGGEQQLGIQALPMLRPVLSNEFTDVFNSILEPLSDWSTSQGASMGFAENGAYVEGSGVADASIGLNMNQFDDMGQLWLWAPDANAGTDLFQR